LSTSFKSASGMASRPTPRGTVVACRMVAAVVGVIGERAAVVAAEGEGMRKAVVLPATRSATRHATLLRVLLMVMTTALWCIFCTKCVVVVVRVC